MENDDNRNLGADPLGEVDQFFTKHSDNFCDPEERIGFLQKSDHETPIKAKNQSLRYYIHAIIDNFVKSVPR